MPNLIRVLPTGAWRPYRATEAHTVVGTLIVDPTAAYPPLRTRRPLYVWLPPTYASESERRYPVLYMQDGQNLFDEALAYGGSEWRVDETLTTLAGEGIEAIAVGISHGGARRVREMTPFGAGNLGEAYLACIADTIKPRIDAEFRTYPDAIHTTMIGSSMGGLISLFAFFNRPDCFANAGVLSPALWPAHGAIANVVHRAPYLPGRIYLDNGTQEPSARPMADLLRAKGYDRNLMYVSDKGGRHTESDWARRLPNALRFLLSTQQ